MLQRGISEEIYMIYIYMVLYEKLLVVLTHVVELMLFFFLGGLGKLLYL